MIKHPQQYLETFAKAGAAYITPHTDCIEGDAFVTINKIKELGCKAGIALNPSVPLETIEYYLPLLDTQVFLDRKSLNKHMTRYVNWLRYVKKRDLIS